MAHEPKYRGDGGVWRKLLIFVNSIFVLFGLGIIAGGLWVILDKRLYITELLGTALFQVALFIIFGIGFLVIFIAFIGLLGAKVRNRRLLAAYFIILVIIFLFLFVGAILGVVLKDAVKNTMRDTMNRTLVRDYNRTQLATKAWDWTQKHLNCCAVDDSGWTIYQNSHWFNHTQKFLEQRRPTEYEYVPASCCRVDERGYIWKRDTCQKYQSGPPKVKDGAKNDYIYYKGCYSRGLWYIGQFSWALFGIGFGVALSLIIGMILSCCTYRNIDDDD